MEMIGFYVSCGLALGTAFDVVKYWLLMSLCVIAAGSYLIY